MALGDIVSERAINGEAGSVEKEHGACQSEAFDGAAESLLVLRVSEIFIPRVIAFVADMEDGFHRRPLETMSLVLKERLKD